MDLLVRGPRGDVGVLIKRSFDRIRDRSLVQRLREKYPDLEYLLFVSQDYATLAPVDYFDIFREVPVDEKLTIHGFPTRSSLKSLLRSALI